MLILDEVFGSLDSDRQRGVVDLLRRVGDRFEQVILISHVDLLQYDVDHGFELNYDSNRGHTVVRPFNRSATDAYEEPSGELVSVES